MHYFGDFRLNSFRHHVRNTEFFIHFSQDFLLKKFAINKQHTLFSASSFALSFERILSTHDDTLISSLEPSDLTSLILFSNSRFSFAVAIFSCNFSACFAFVKSLAGACTKSVSLFLVWISSDPDFEPFPTSRGARPNFARSLLNFQFK